VRLETHPEPSIRLDVLLSRPDLDAHSVVELKYLTRGWAGEIAGEQFALKNHGAQDIRAYDVVKDIGRVERFVADRPGWNGAMIAFTNDHSYWQPGHPREANQPSSVPALRGTQPVRNPGLGAAHRGRHHEGSRRAGGAGPGAQPRLARVLMTPRQ
jgi:hypothetical protein